MDRDSDTYSRLVALAKIVLPLLALAILSTLFLVSRAIDPSDAIPYAEVDVRELAREQRVGTPRYTGVTSDGAAVSVNADTARPEGGDLDRVSSTAVVANIRTGTGLTIGVAADAGTVDTGAGLLNLDGNVVITTTTGWRMETDALEATLDQTHLKTDTAVVATGPLGRLDAGRMDLSWQGGGTPGKPATGTGTSEPGGYVLVFNDGVKLVYEPPK